MERASAPREWCIEMGESLTDTNRSDSRASRKARGEHTKHFSNCGESHMCKSDRRRGGGDAGARTKHLKSLPHWLLVQYVAFRVGIITVFYALPVLGTIPA